MAMYTGAKWGSAGFGSSGGTITWSFATLGGILTDSLEVMHDPTFRHAVRTAFHTWDSLADLAFIEIADSVDSDIRLGWSAIDGRGKVLATATWQQQGAMMLRAEIGFDIAEYWSVVPSIGSVDFATVAIHEIGHAIGLDHFDDPSSVMYAYGGSRKELSVEDVQAIEALYGAEPQPARMVTLPPGFVALEYIASYGDLIAGFGLDADAGTAHYLAHGSREGRSMTFDPLEYIASYADLARHFGADAAGATAHFITDGYREGRTISFDSLAYIASHADLARWLGPDADRGAMHFIFHGRGEGRTVPFDGLAYIASHHDLILSFGADADSGAVHFIAHGRAEGRGYAFDGLEYIASYGDLIRGFGADADRGSEHYILHGHREGRAMDLFDAEQYLANYADLRAGFGADFDAAARHYVEYGYFEGRTDDFLF